MAERDFNLEMTGEQVKDALQQLEDRVAEGWAVGEHDGVPVTSGSPYYHNNSEWWAQQSAANATAAAESAATAEAEVEEGVRQGIVGAYVQETATPGAIVTIDDGADNIPLKDLKVALAINQPGTGDPSPSNVRPIYPVTEAEVTRQDGNGDNVEKYLVNIGINQWDEEWEVGTINNDTGAPEADSNNIRSKNFCPCIAGTDYNIVSKDSKVLRYYFYDKSQTFISGGATSGTNTIITAPTGACYFKVRTTSSYGSTYLSDISVNFPSRFTDYYAYTGHIVYGGDADITPGALSSKYAMIDMGTMNWIYSSGAFYSTDIASVIKKPASTSSLGNYYCSALTQKTGVAPWATTGNQYNCASNGNIWAKTDESITDPTTFKASLAGFQLVYELATPISIQLDPTAVNTLRGDNVIWADCGDITNCEYRADLKMYIDKVVGA